MRASAWTAGSGATRRGSGRASRASALALASCVALALTRCGDEVGASGDQGFVSGDGVITVVDEEDRAAAR